MGKEKCYTIIDLFENGSEAWVVHYVNKDDAVECLRKYLSHYGLVNDNDCVPIDQGKSLCPVRCLFDYLSFNGCGYTYCLGADSGVIFVRNEWINKSFDDSDLPFDMEE